MLNSFANNMMESQLLRLEANLRRYNPTGLSKLMPGLSQKEIDETALKHNVILDPDVAAIYRWRAGGRILLAPEEVWDGHDMRPLICFYFLGLDEALKQGQAARPNLYAEPNIVPEKTLNNRICPFANFGSLDYSGQFEEVDRLWLPCETRAFIEYDVPLFYDTHDYDQPAHFSFDSLVHFIDYVNYNYDGGSSLENATLPETLPQMPEDKRPFFQRPSAPIEEFRRLNNPYCAEVNKSLYFCEWP